MKIFPAVLLLVMGSGATAPVAESPERELTRALDQFYTWGDVVLRFKCRVHGRWLDHSGSPARQGQFFGDLEYGGGALTYRPVRSLGRERDPDEIRADLAALIEQAGLLPTGFPLPPGEVTRSAVGNGASKASAGDSGVTHFEVRSSRRATGAPIRFRVERGRVTGVTVPDGGGPGTIRLRIQSSWIPGDRYLVTRLTGNRGPRNDHPRVAYHYRCHAGNYFPRTITEERDTKQLSITFYWYDIELEP